MATKKLFLNYNIVQIILNILVRDVVKIKWIEDLSELLGSNAAKDDKYTIRFHKN